MGDRSPKLTKAETGFLGDLLSFKDKPKKRNPVQGPMCPCTQKRPKGNPSRVPLVKFEAMEGLYLARYYA